MTKNISYLVIVAATVLMSFMPMAATKYLADAKISSIKWTSSAEGQTSHNGTLNFKSGNLMVDSKIIQSGFFYIDMQTLACNDIADAGFNKEFVNELRDESNFNLVKFKQSTIKVLKAKRTEPTGETDNYDLTLEVNIKGLKKSYTVPAKATYSKKNVQLTADLAIPASDFGMVYDLTLALDIMADKQ